ncbi:26S proteasome non-ATPase regulatory subunit 5 [Brevipalpus obovatus]|uniref:26S proteasome non-ATPase regulatory subunit 5 n=1 Tax=Brevipalpus obovatus TaxID=246614 RepID=UPI003D9F4678
MNQNANHTQPMLDNYLQSALNNGWRFGTKPGVDFNLVGNIPPPPPPPEYELNSGGSTSTTPDSKSNEKLSSFSSLSRSHQDLSKLDDDLNMVFKNNLHLNTHRYPSSYHSLINDCSPNAQQNMIDLLRAENLSLRNELENCSRKVSRLQKLEMELQKVHTAHEDLMKSSEKKEKLERAIRYKLEIEIKSARDENKSLKDHLNAALNTIANSKRNPEGYIDDNEFRNEIQRRDVLIAQLLTQNKEWISEKERQEIELQAQRLTLEEQRNHIEVLDNALMNAQNNVVKLEAELRKKKKLLEIKAILIGTSSQDLVSTMESLGITQFLESINSCEPDDKEYFSEVLGVLSLALDSLPSQYILNNLCGPLKSGLSSRHVGLKTVWLRCLDHSLSSPENFKELFHLGESVDTGILAHLINIIGEDDETNSKYATEILMKCMKIQELQNILFSDEVEHEWNNVKQKKEITQMRVLEMMAKAACLSEGLTKKVEESGNLEQLMQCIQSDDTLIQLNSLQILFYMTSTSLGAKYLHENGHLKWLEGQLMGSSAAEPLCHIVASSMISVFGNFGKICPSLMIENYSDVIRKLLSHCEQESYSSLMTTSVAVFANIASSLEGKKVLNSVENFASICMKCLARFILADFDEKRVEALNCLQKMFSIDEDDANGEGETLTETWFEHLDEQKKMIPTLIHFSHRPFPEIRLPALNFLRILATHLWGQKLLAKDPNFLKILLDRSKGMDKEGKEARFEVIKELSISPFTAHAFNREQVKLIQKYYQEGPFFVERESMVSFEAQ